MKIRDEFKVGDRVKFHPEIVAAVYWCIKEKNRKKAEVKEVIFTVVDVSADCERLANFSSEISPEIKEFSVFLLSTVKTKKNSLVLIGDYQSEQKVCIEGLSGERRWLRASYFEKVN